MQTENPATEDKIYKNGALLDQKDCSYSSLPYKEMPFNLYRQISTQWDARQKYLKLNVFCTLKLSGCNIENIYKKTAPKSFSVCKCLLKPNHKSFDK